MELQDFVKKVCFGVVRGMEEAREKLGHEIKIAPEAIEFDVAVAVESSKEVNGKIEVLGSLAGLVNLGGGVDGGWNNTFTNTNRVRFKMLVSSKSIEDQEKQRAEIRRVMEEQRNFGR